MNPARITFTGIDRKTDVGALKAICAMRPEVEFAILQSNKRVGKDNRYLYDSHNQPYNNCGTDLIRAALPKNQLATHLCGDLAEKFATGDYHPLSEYGRVQVNLKEYSIEQYFNLAKVARRHNIEIIVQDRSELEIEWIPGLQVLHDCSGGRGLLNNNWPSPSKLYGPRDIVSYAGGLSPDNIIDQLWEIDGACDDNVQFGIDMESGVRTDDWFDIDKVIKVLKEVDKWKEEKLNER